MLIGLQQKSIVVFALAEQFAALAAGVRRIRPCLMTAATTILALIPVLTASGRGADLMLPMAIPTFGGMMAVVLTAPVVPVLYCAVEEWKLRVASYFANEGWHFLLVEVLDIQHG